MAAEPLAPKGGVHTRRAPRELGPKSLGKRLGLDHTPGVVKACPRASAGHLRHRAAEWRQKEREAWDKKMHDVGRVQAMFAAAGKSFQVRVPPVVL